MCECSIKVNNLVKIYNLYDSPKDRLKEILHVGKNIRHQEYRALNGIHFEVKKGETFGVIGTNGAGKSTLLKIPVSRPPAKGRLPLTEKSPHYWNWGQDSTPNIPALRIFI